jgi:hypothetical protein
MESSDSKLLQNSGKYAVSSRELEQERNETLKTLDGFLKGYGIWNEHS